MMQLSALHSSETDIIDAVMQDVILMADSCDMCGYKSSEIKAGGAISDHGRLITLQVTEQEDLRRDIIKADSASVSACIPALSSSILNICQAHTRDCSRRYDL